MSSPKPLKPRIAVLPIRAKRGSLAQSDILRVLTDDLVSALAARPQLQVLSRLSVHAFDGRAQESLNVERTLGADYYVRSELTRVGEKLFLELDLTERDELVWSGHFESDAARTLDAESSLAKATADALCCAVFRRQMQRSHTAAMPNLPGYTLLLQAMALLHHLSVDDVRRSHAILDHLSDRHPRAPEVHAWLAKWHFLQIAQSWVKDRAGAARTARQYLGRALEVEPLHGLALAIEGHLHAFEDRSPLTAEAHLLDAARKAPNEPLVWLFLANVQAMLGKGNEAVKALERAQALSPFDPLSYLTDLIASIVYSAAGRNEMALDFAQRSVTQNCLHLSSQIQLLFAQADMGRMDEARRTAARYLELRPGASIQRFIDHHFAIETSLAKRQVAALMEAGIPM